jgi:hypothetical protein
MGGREGNWPLGGLFATASDRFAVGILAVLALVVALTFRDYGLGWDDYTHTEYADLLLALFSSGFQDQRAFGFVNLYMYGGGFDMAAALAHKVLPFDLFETRRLLGGLVGLAGILITWRLARRLGGPLAGLAAVVLLAICPLFYGHMFMNPKDVPFAVAVIALVYTLVRAIEEYPRPHPATVMLFGLALGLVIGTRVMGGMVAIYALVAGLLLVTIEARAAGFSLAARRAITFVVALLPGVVVAYLVMGLVWPWSVTEVLAPFKALSYFSTFFEKPWRELFEGTPILVPNMPRSYVPVLFVSSMPEIFVVLVIAGAVLTIGAIVWGREMPRRRAALTLVLFAALFPLVLAVAMRPAMYNGLRHFTFVVPALAVLGGLAAAQISAYLARQRIGYRLAAASLAAAGLAMPVADFILLHPYQYTYFNRTSGGVKAADERFMLDYWGLAFKQAAEELRGELTERMETPTNNKKWRVATCGPQRVAQVNLGDEFETTWDARGADFAMVLGEFYCADLKAPVIVEIEREDVVYARVYDIRGRTVANMLTLPPP